MCTTCVFSLGPPEPGLTALWRDRDFHILEVGLFRTFSRLRPSKPMLRSQWSRLPDCGPSPREYFPRSARNVPTTSEAKVFELNGPFPKRVALVVEPSFVVTRIPAFHHLPYMAGGSILAISSHLIRWVRSGFRITRASGDAQIPVRTKPMRNAVMTIVIDPATIR